MCEMINSDWQCSHTDTLNFTQTHTEVFGNVILVSVWFESIERVTVLTVIVMCGRSSSASNGHVLGSQIKVVRTKHLVYFVSLSQRSKDDAVQEIALTHMI